MVRVPSHYEPTKAAIEAGKHVYTEWPLGRTTAEAEELAALARAKGVQTAVGLQSRVSPTLLYVKERIEEGYVGEVLSCHADCMRDGALERPSTRTWQRDATLGANPLTIANGHVIDALRFVVGDFARVSCMVTTQAKQWLETDTGQMVDVTSPDNIMVSGKLARGAVASVHVAAVPWAGGGFRMVIYGREGTLVATGNVSSQRGEMLRVQGAQRQPSVERHADTRSLRLDASRFPARRPVQRRADVQSVRGSDSHRAAAEQTADVRYRRRPASLPRYDQAVVGNGTGVAGRLVQLG